MASEQELNRAEDLLKKQEAINKAKEKQRELDADILGLSSSLVDSIKEIQGISTKRSTFDQNLLKVNKSINKEISGQKSGLSDISTVQKQIAKNSDLIKQSKRTTNAITANLNTKEKEAVLEAQKQMDIAAKMTRYQDQQLDQAAKTGKYNKSGVDLAEKMKNEALEAVGANSKGLSQAAQQAIFTSQHTKELERQNSLRKTEEETLEAINKSLGLSGGLAKAFGKIPGLGDKSEKAFGKVQDKIKGMVEKDGIGAIPNRLTTASMFAEEFGNILMDAATDPLVIITAIGAAMLKNNKKITEFSRSMAMSTEDAKTFAGEFSSIAYSSDDINTTTANLVHNFQDMSEALGFMAKFSKDTLETSTKLQYSLGISAESVANLAGAAEVTGGNFDDQYKNALAISHEAQRELGVRVDLRKVLEQSGKVTGQIRANLGGSIEEIAEAVTKATLFGSTLEDVANMGSKLLDFESSITAELEAEMLIGKNLNLERARAAALAGDQVTLMEELNSQMGSLEDFQNMNVIQQQALASAMGMTGDQLSDILMKQEIQGRTAEELKAMGKDELAAIVEKQDAQQSFNAAVAQLKGLLADSVKFLNPIMEGFSFIVQKAVEFKDVFLALTGLQLAYIGYQKISKALKVADLALTKKNFFQSLGSLIVEAAKSVAKIPFVGPALAIAAGAAIYGAFKGYGSKGDDIMSPGGNASGYGNRTLFGPEGAISLNNKDTVIAGTNLFDKGDDVISKGAGEVKIPTQDNRVGNETNRLLQTLIGQNAKKPELSPVGLYEVQ